MPMKPYIMMSLFMNKKNSNLNFSATTNPKEVMILFMVAALHQVVTKTKPGYSLTDQFDCKSMQPH